MQHFQNILFVPIIKFKNAEPFDRAVALAQSSDAALTFYGVVSPGPSVQQMVQLGSPPRSVTELLVEDLTESLRANAKRYADRLPVTVEVDVGRPPVEVVRRAIANQHDLVILSVDGSEDRAALARRVLRTCPCPVLVLRAKAETSRVLAAVDPEGEIELNQSIIKLARSLATDSESELHIVHGWQLHGETTLLSSENVQVDPRELAEFATLVEANHRQQMNHLLESVDEDPYGNVHFVNGGPVSAISGLVEMYRIDLLVMGSIGRNDGDGLLVGNTAEQVFGKVTCSSLVVKPPGFVSPIHRVTNA